MPDLVGDVGAKALDRTFHHAAMANQCNESGDAATLARYLYGGEPLLGNGTKGVLPIFGLYEHITVAPTSSAAGEKLRDRLLVANAV